MPDTDDVVIPPILGRRVAGGNVVPRSRYDALVAAESALTVERQRADDLLDALDAQRRHGERIAELYQGACQRADALVAENAALRAAFIKHRTATHEVRPTFCVTCRESDAVLGQAGGQDGG